MANKATWESKMTRRAKIAGTGSYVPERKLTNADLEKIIDTTDEWITSRCGIKERRIVSEGESTSKLAHIAAEHALKGAGYHRRHNNPRYHVSFHSLLLAEEPWLRLRGVV